jgi:hypothetical protein
MNYYRQYREIPYGGNKTRAKEEKYEKDPAMRTEYYF